jgi:hypothetical protein
LQLADYDHDVLKQFPVYIYVFPHIYPEADAYGSPRGPSFLAYMNCYHQIEVRNKLCSDKSITTKRYLLMLLALKHPTYTSDWLCL